MPKDGLLHHEASEGMAAKGTVNGNKTVSLPQGLYIIKLGSKTYKVLVR